MYRGLNGAWGMAGYPVWAHWGGIALAIAIVVAIVLGVVAIRRSGTSGRRERGVAEARGLDVLAERFARGEIDAETYRSMRAELESNP